MATLEDLLTSRIPPADLAAERAVLGSVLLDREPAWEIAAPRLAVADFYLERHRQVWQACADCMADDLGVDTVTVARRLTAMEALPPEEIAPWLSALIAETATLTNLRSYVRLVARDSARRRLITLATQAIGQAYDRQAEPLRIAGELVRALEGLVGPEAEGVLPAPVSTLGESLDAVMAELAQPGRRLSVVPLPFPGVNRRLGGGFYPGELVLLGARAGVGKTAMALEIARHAAAHGRGVLVVSREMTNLALTKRMLAQASGVSALSLRTGRVEPGEMMLLRDALPRLRRLPVWLTDQAATLDQVRRLVLEPGPMRLGLVIVDYLQLLRAPKEIRERRFQVEAISAGLKAIALDAGLPVLCLSSLARAEPGHRDRRPTMADLRESGELEHDADVILLLHRPPREAATEGIIAKARDAETAIVPLTFHPRTVHFTEDAERVGG